MILFTILAAVYLIGLIGSYKLTKRMATGENYVSKPVLGTISLFWPLTVFYTLAKAASN